MNHCSLDYVLFLHFCAVSPVVLFHSFSNALEFYIRFILFPLPPSLSQLLTISTIAVWVSAYLTLWILTLCLSNLFWLWISWFPQLCLCEHCRNLEFMIYDFYMICHINTCLWLLLLSNYFHNLVTYKKADMPKWHQMGQSAWKPNSHVHCKNKQFNIIPWNMQYMSMKWYFVLTLARSSRAKAWRSASLCIASLSSSSDKSDECWL